MAESESAELAAASEALPFHEHHSEHEHYYHLYAVEKREPSRAATGHVVRGDDKPVTTFRTTSTAAVAVDEEDAADARARGLNASPLSSTTSSECNEEESGIHSLLLNVTDMLHPDDQCIMSVALESNKYLVVILRERFGQAALLGMERDDEQRANFNLAVVLPVVRHATVKLDGDGGFEFQLPGTRRRVFSFKPSSVQSLWSAVQALFKVMEGADTDDSDAWQWLAFYKDKIHEPEAKLHRWSQVEAGQLSELEIIRRQVSTLNEQQPQEPQLDHNFEKRMIAKLKEMMFASDLDTVTSRELRLGLEEHFKVPLKKYKRVIDEQMITIMGQMEPSSKIFDYLYLGTEWNASNWEELEANNCRFILNVTREIPNFFPQHIQYYNVRIWDVPSANLWPEWENTYNFLRKARHARSSVLVHCKMGVSRSASTVIAYAMKQYGWNLAEAHAFVKKRRRIIKPNEGFKQQLTLYEGMLRAKRESGNWGERVSAHSGKLLRSLSPEHGNDEAETAMAALRTSGAPIPIQHVTPPDSPVSTPPGSPPPVVKAWVNGSYKTGSFTRSSRGGSSSRSRSTTPSAEISSGDDHATAGAAAEFTEDGVQLRRRRRRRHTTSIQTETSRARPASMHEVEQLRREHILDDPNYRPRSGSDGTSERLKGLINQFSRLSSHPDGSQPTALSEHSPAGKNHQLAFSTQQHAAHGSFEPSNLDTTSSHGKAQSAPASRGSTASIVAGSIIAENDERERDDEASTADQRTILDVVEHGQALPGSSKPSNDTLMAAAEVSEETARSASSEPVQASLPRQRSADAILRPSTAQAQILTSGNTAQDRRVRLPMPPRGFRRLQANQQTADDGNAAARPASPNAQLIVHQAQSTTTADAVYTAPIHKTSTAAETLTASGAATPGRMSPASPSKSSFYTADYVHRLEERVGELEGKLGVLLSETSLAAHVLGENSADKIRTWDPEGVARFLASVGLGDYEELFEEQNISGADLLDLTHADLFSIGISTLSERKRILRALHRLADYA